MNSGIPKNVVLWEHSPGSTEYCADIRARSGKSCEYHSDTGDICFASGKSSRYYSDTADVDGISVMLVDAIPIYVVHNRFSVNVVSGPALTAQY